MKETGPRPPRAALREAGSSTDEESDRESEAKSDLESDMGSDGESKVGSDGDSGVADRRGSSVEDRRGSGVEAGSDLEVSEVFPGRRRDRRAFADLPFRLARSWDAWQPGFRRLQEDLIHPKRNPFWKERAGSFFVAGRSGRVVGRMAVVDPGQIPQRPGAAVLAFPDFVDDRAVFDRLLEAVQIRARARGATALLGPMNPNIHHDVGIQVEGHDRRNAAFMGFQPPYYRSHFERAGFERVADFEAWALSRETFIAGGRLGRLAERVQRRQPLRIRPLDLGDFAGELRLFHRLYSDAFADHWGFTAPSWDEFRFIAGDLRHILKARMALVAECAGRPVGFALGIPDLYQILPRRSRGRITPLFVIDVLRRWRSMDEVRVMIAGVLPAYRRYGVHLALFHRIAREIFALGYRGGEISWVFSGNRAMAKALPLLGARRTKTYRTYVKHLPPDAGVGCGAVDDRHQ